MLKKIMKKDIIVAFIIGLIVASSITVYATNIIANQIAYTREGTQINNVEQALNDLYNKQLVFDDSDNVIMANDVELTGLQPGKYYIIYLRDNSLPTFTGIEFVIPMKKMEIITSTNVSKKTMYVGVGKATDTAITLSNASIISAKLLYL